MSDSLADHPYDNDVSHHPYCFAKHVSQCDNTSVIPVQPYASSRQ